MTEEWRLDVAAVRRWLDAYKHGWETHNSALIGRLFTDDARYYIKPFDNPLHGRASIMNYWIQIAETQEKVVFDANILAVTGNHGIAHWSASFTRVSSGKRIQLDGVLLAEFEPDLTCSLFREWWHRKEDVP